MNTIKIEEKKSISSTNTCMIKREILMAISITLWITEQARVESYGSNLGLNRLSAPD